MEVRRIYEQFRDRSIVRWKDSYREILGLPALAADAEATAARTVG